MCRTLNFGAAMEADAMNARMAVKSGFMVVALGNAQR
jgi:hypothetical protein